VRSPLGLSAGAGTIAKTHSQCHIHMTCLMERKRETRLPPAGANETERRAKGYIMPVIHEWHRNSHKTQGAMALAMSMEGLTCEYSWCSSSPFSTTTGVSQLSKVMLPSVVGEPSILKLEELPPTRATCWLAHWPACDDGLWEALTRIRALGVDPEARRRRN
jgi:hypothetical protein